MDKAFRKTGIDIISDAPWGTHLCQFYETREDLVDILVPYFKAGLENNEFCMWITSKPLKVEDAKAALKKVVKNLDDCIKKGQIEILDYGEWYTKSGKFDANNVLQGWVEKENQALKRGYDGLRLSGNTFWLAKRDWRNFTDYEEKINKVIGKYRMIAICTYSLDKCGTSEVIDVISNHQFALIRREGKWVIIESSERKRVGEALWESEKRYRNLVESIIDVVYAIDSSGVLTYISPVVKNILGYEPDELIGRQFLELVHKEDQDLLMRRFSELSEGIVKHSDYRLIGKHGDIKWVRTLTNPIIEEGGFVGARGVLIDITERKKVEEALRESEEIFTQFMNYSPTYVFFKDENIKTIKLSKNYTEMLGRPISELLGKNMDDLFPSDLAKSMVADDRRILKEGKTVEIEEGMNGRFYSTIKFPIYREGKPTYLAGFTIDITERKRAEEELRKSIQFLNDTGEMANVGGWELDLSTKEVSWTEGVGRIHGVEPGYKPKLEEALNFYAPESRPDVEAVLKKAAETGEPYDLESLFIPRGSKDKIWVRSLGKAVYSGGKIVKLTGTFQNIDKYKRAEEALRVSLEKYRVLFESFPLGITISDKSGKIMETNRQSEQLLGITREVHAQRGIDSKEWQIIRKDGTPMPADEYASTRALRENRLIENVEMGIVKDKGEITWIGVTAAPIPLEGYGVVIAYGDITERKRAQEALQESEIKHRTLLENLPQKIFRKDRKSVYMACNENYARDLKIKPYEIHGKTDYDFFHKELAEKYQADDKQVMESGKTKDIDERYVQDGREAIVHTTKTPLRDGQGNVIGLLGIFRDITERKRAEDQLRDSEKQLRALAARLQSVREEERGMIAREIHDELGQVLTGLKMDLFWLSSKLPEDQKSLLGKTKSMLELIDTTIQSVRKLSTELRPGVLDNLGLKAAIEWQIGEFQTRTGIRCELIAPEEDIALDQDCSTAVFRIFQEALTNVVRHSNATRVNITLEKSADHLLLEVQDNGKGIEESKIFNLESLGLLGMRERALYLGGKVKFEGIQGKGTKVTVLIPPKGKMGEMEVRDYD